MASGLVSESNSQKGQITKECPTCGKLAVGNTQIQQLFGFRTMKEGVVRPQSYCRTCRTEHHRKMSSLKNEEIEYVQKKETPSFVQPKRSDKKTFDQLIHFIENEMYLQANYQLVMLKVLAGQKKTHKAEIAEELAYYNNKNTSDVNVIKKF